MDIFTHLTDFARHVPAFGEGFITTFKIAALGAVVASITGFLSGMVCAYRDLLKVSSGKRLPHDVILSGTARLYIAIFRGIPLAILLFTMYYILQLAGLRMSVMAVAVAGIGLYHGVYVSEILRRSVAAVPDHMRNNACCMGYTDPQILWHILLPAASRAIMPSLLTTLSVIVRNTSVVMIITGAGVLGTAESFANFGTREYTSASLFAGAVYMMISLPLAHFAKLAQLRVANDTATDIKPGTSGFIRISKGLMEC